MCVLANLEYLSILLLLLLLLFLYADRTTAALMLINYYPQTDRQTDTRPLLYVVRRARDVRNDYSGKTGSSSSRDASCQQIDGQLQ